MLEIIAALGNRQTKREREREESNMHIPGCSQAGVRGEGGESCHGRGKRKRTEGKFQISRTKGVSGASLEQRELGEPAR